MGKIIEVKNVSVKYITGDLRNIGLKEFVMKKLTHQYRAEEFLAVTMFRSRWKTATCSV